MLEIRIKTFDTFVGGGGGDQEYLLDDVTLSLNAPIMMDYIIDGYGEVKDYNDFIHNLSLLNQSSLLNQ